MTYVSELQEKSRVGLSACLKREEKRQRLEARKQKEIDLAEANELITEAEAPGGVIARATKKGQREAVVCVLRGGIHFSDEFHKEKSPRFLGTIGKKICQHFLEKGLEVSFRGWDDPMRIRELPSDSGYQLVISW